MKKIKRLLFVFCLLIINPLCVYAAGGLSIEFEDFSDSGSSSVVPTDPFKEVILSTWKNGNSEYTCSYKYNIKVKTSLKFNIYDINNKSLIDKSLTINERVVAGTSVGILIKEAKTSEYEIKDIILKKVQEVRKPTTKTIVSKICYYAGSNSCDTYKITMNPYTTNCPGMHPDIAFCRNTGEDIEVTTQKINGLSTTTTYNETTGKNNENYTQCKSKAIDAVQRKSKDAISGESYKASLTNSNDVDKEKEQINDIKSTISTNTSGLKGKYSANYTYNMGNVCLNLKTAKITYRTASGSCLEDEVKIANDTTDGDNHWHYFIPLNSRSTDKIEIEFSKSHNSKLNKKTCKNIIEKYKKNKEYLDFIVPLEGGKYNGNVANDKIITDSSNGCRQVSIIKIPISQEFYYETKLETDSLTKSILQGKNFYFRRIDINNPFNNISPKEDSLWYDWYDANYTSEGYTRNIKEPNINNSFKEPLYITKINNIEKLQEIRRYNIIRPYPEWVDMKSNGESCLIVNGDATSNLNCSSFIPIIAERIKNENKIYKLGEGEDLEICEGNIVHIDGKCD